MQFFEMNAADISPPTGDERGKSQPGAMLMSRLFADSGAAVVAQVEAEVSTFVLFFFLSFYFSLDSFRFELPTQ